MISDLIQNKIPTLFEKEIDKLDLHDLSIFFCRKDGIPLYDYESTNMVLDRNSICALFCGAWQAVEAMTKYFSSNNQDEVHRFSFDTSSSGVYLLPVEFKSETFILGILYEDILNPGFLKEKIRRLRKSIVQFLNNNINADELNNESGFLFKEITDEEIDSLFMMQGN